MSEFPAGCGLLIIYACIVLYRSLRVPRWKRDSPYPGVFRDQHGLARVRKPLN